MAGDSLRFHVTRPSRIPRSHDAWRGEAARTVDDMATQVLEQSVQHGATLLYVPTSHPRHTITETPVVHEALEELRAVLGRGRIDFGELAVLGARAKLEQLRGAGPAVQAARMRLAREIREGTVEVDIAAADRVKRLGLLGDDEL
jgi:hypothetical protein